MAGRNHRGHFRAAGFHVQTGSPGARPARPPHEVSRSDQTAFRRKQSDDGMDARGFEAFLKRHRGKNRRDSFGKHRLACARRADEQHLVDTVRGIDYVTC